MISQKLLKEIDYIIKTTWKTCIKKDYLNDYVLREDSLKSCIYYHLRRKLSKILKENNLRIYTEYTFSNLSYRADIVIAKISDKEVDYLKDAIENEKEDVVAIFELKYIATSDRATVDWTNKDIEKIKDYIKIGKLKSQFYFCVIYEVECERLNWMNKKATNNWANGNVTELNAGYINDSMKFEVHSYNNLNKELND